MIVGLTGVIAFATVLYTIVAERQLHEIYTGSKDTHYLAIAGGKQADAARIQSEQAKAQTEKMTESIAKTDDLIQRATEQARATNKLAQQAKRQADTAISSFDASERPYIGIERISYVEDQLNKIVTIVAILKNFGANPAEGLQIHYITTLGGKVQGDYGMPLGESMEFFFLEMRGVCQPS